MVLFICQDTICVLHSLLFSLILKFSLAQSYFQFVIKVFFNFDITVAEKASKECLIYYEEKNSRVMCELAHWFANCLVHIVDPGSNEANSHDRINMTKIRVRTWPKNFHNDKPKQLSMTKKYYKDEHYLSPQKYSGVVGLDRSPSPISQARTGRDTCLASLAPSLCSSTRIKHIRHWWRLLFGDFWGLNF